MQRLLLQNNTLGDDIRFLGAEEISPSELVIFTDQPIYDGTEPTHPEVE